MDEFIRHYLAPILFIVWVLYTGIVIYFVNERSKQIKKDFYDKNN